MNIALLLTGLQIGGAESQVVSLADRFAALGHRVLMIALTGEPALRPVEPGVEVACLRMAKTSKGFVAGYRQARCLLRAFRPQVVHSHMVHANLFARLLRVTTDMPRLICTAHSTNEGGFLRMRAYALTDWMADMTTNVSETAVAAYLRRHAAAPHKITVVRNGIDCSRFRFDPAVRAGVRQALGLPEQKQMVLAVGRVAEEKDYGNLLHAFAGVTARRGDCVLAIAGDGPGLSRYQALAESLRIADQVRFLGMRRDVPQLMTAADVFVLSSSWEGWPLVIGEALACERVVVATDAGGIGGWLGEIGSVVPIRDSRALAQALLGALQMQSDEKKAKGRAGRERILADYSLEAVAARWLEIYRGNYFGNEAPVRLAAQ
jgi:glycosyltransferase involved in cell wall biosynthesis